MMAPWSENFERYLFHHLHSSLTFPVVVAVVVDHAIIGVKRFRYGGSVVPAMLSASGIRIFTTKLRGLLHQSGLYSVM